MGLFIGFLTVILALSSVFLVFLILLQLPKKEAGAGVAFGGSTADTLFGAGSGNVLTKLTKYTTTIFLSLCLILTVLESHYVNRAGKGFGEKLKSKEKPVAMPVQPQAATPANPNASANGALQSVPTGSNSALQILTTTNNAGAATNKTSTPAPKAAAPATTTPVPEKK